MPLWLDIRGASLPRNPNGKIDRALLAREVAELLAPEYGQPGDKS